MIIKPNVTAPPTILKATSNNPTFNGVPKERLGKKFVRLLSKATSRLLELAIGDIRDIDKNSQ